MTEAVCFRCGNDKPGPFVACSSCAVRPATDDELAMSLVLSLHTNKVERLDTLARVLRSGRQPESTGEQLSRAREALKDPQLRTMLGLGVGKPPSPTPQTRPAEFALESNPANVDPDTTSHCTVRPDAPEETALHRNPFYMLKVTARDNRRRIVEMAEEQSLSLDPAVCSKASSDLTNPRNRLAVEMAWMPGVSPSRAKTLVGGLRTHLAAIQKLGNTPSLAHANLMAAGFELLNPDLAVKEWAGWIVHMAHADAEIDTETVMREINEDRAVAGFPEIAGVEAVEGELAGRRRYYKNSVKEALNRLPTMKLVDTLNQVVAVTTSGGESHAPLLVDELVDAYDLETRKYLQQEADNVGKVIDALKESAHKGAAPVSALLDRLDEVVRKWDRVAQPIQLSMKSRGLDHDMSLELAYKIRSIGIDLHNEHGLLECAQRVTVMLQEVFQELPIVAERLDEDAAAIEDLLEKKGAAKQEEAEWDRSITYSTQIGVLFKDTLAISPKGIQWGERIYPLDSITRVRWGATRHSMNGIPTGTTYTIYFGSDEHDAQVETRREEVFKEFQGRLWKAVVAPLITKMVRSLGQGKKYHFADLVLDDAGAEITKHKVWGADQRVYGTWDQMHVWSANGSFFVGLKDDKKAYSELSYQETDNAHLVETMIRMSFKKGGVKLSRILD